MSDWVQSNFISSHFAMLQKMLEKPQTLGKPFKIPFNRWEKARVKLGPSFSC